MGHKELFKGLAIEQLETEWKEYPVIHLDFNTGSYTRPSGLDDQLNCQLDFFERIYGRNPVEVSFGSRFLGVIRRIYEKTGKKVVVLIDEYDKPLLEVLDSELMNADRTRKLEDIHRETMQEFYTAIKSADEYLKFVFLMGGGGVHRGQLLEQGERY